MPVPPSLICNDKDDLQPLDELERPSYERYGLPLPPPGLLHQLRDFFAQNWKSFFPPLIWIPQYRVGCGCFLAGF